MESILEASTHGVAPANSPTRPTDSLHRRGRQGTVQIAPEETPF